ncbi:MAG: glycogen/starch/alpha-glucan phosphorylase, partial [Clostridium sp.]|nr:glycogen/starch/alpha-glucan phosphorylase [Clostridium sp.]
HMANLCVAMTFNTNGVSQLHGDILKAETFNDFYQVMPEKFSHHALHPLERPFHAHALS